VDSEEVRRRVRRDLQFLEDEVSAILLYGSWATGEAHPGSDIDICIVAPEAQDKIRLWRVALAGIHEQIYDLRVFELMPLFLKMEVIERGIVIYAHDIYELYEYFYPFRRVWEDQKHRQGISLEEALAMFGSKASVSGSR
jgi:uncharacterized protein